MIASLLVLLALGGGGDTRPLDTVELEGGTKLQGRVLYEDAEELVLRVGSNERTLARKKITHVDSRATRVRELYDRWRKLGENDLPGTLELARSAREAKFENEAQLFAWYVLARTPRDAAAHELLGHKPHGESWTVEDGTRHWPYEKLLELRKDWGNAWVFATEHYRVRTNLPLADAVSAALDMEATYRSFFELLGGPLRLFELCEPLAAEVHADAKSFPESADRGRSYFDGASHTLFVNASNGFDRGSVVHESSHQLLDACALNTRSARGDVPGWLDEGLAEYLRASTVGPSGRSLSQPEAFDLGRFKEHAQAKEPFDLDRVLAFESGDFLGTSHTALKYAQAYTLVHWGLQGEDGKYRERFFAYLREVWKGHSSSTAFKDELKLKETAIEKSWIAHVRAKAGVK